MLLVVLLVAASSPPTSAAMADPHNTATHSDRPMKPFALE